MEQKIGDAITHQWALVKAALLPSFGCVALLVCAAQLRAQVQSGISGTVTDSSQAVIGGARVTITNMATGVVSTTASSTAGTFNSIGLIPGEYSIVVDAAGFTIEWSEVLREPEDRFDARFLWILARAPEVPG